VPTARSPSRWRNGHDNENFQFSILHRIHVGRVARCYRNHRYSRRICCKCIEQHSGESAHYARHEQPAPDSACYADISERQRWRILFADHELDDITSSKVPFELEDNDSDGAYFLPTTNWMTSLHPKYLSNWKIFQSPFDKRAPSENNTTAPVSYGFNANAKSGSNPLTSDNITNPSVFVLFAPAQGTLTTVSFTGTAANSVTVDKAGGSQGTALGGTHNKRRRINACMADLHVENMLWSVYKNGTNSSSDPSASQRWNP